MTNTGANEGLINIEPLTAKASAARRYREQNREYIREYDWRYSAEHREQKRANAAEWYQGNRRKKKDANADRYAIIGGFINAVREKESCADCEHSTAPLEFDHLPERGEKLFDVGAFGRRAIKTIKAEIAKCELVCKPCHNWRTVARLSGIPLHLNKHPRKRLEERGTWGRATRFVRLLLRSLRSHFWLSKASPSRAQPAHPLPLR